MEVMLDTSQFEFAAGNAVRPVLLQDASLPDLPGILGSCTMLAFDKRLFIACTRHQIGVRFGQEDQIKMSASPLFVSHTSSGILENIPVTKCLFSTASHEEEHADVLLFETTTAMAKQTSELRHFYPLSTFWKGERLHSLAIGCPSAKRILEYEPLRVEFVTEAFACSFDQSFKSASQFVRRFEFAQLPSRNLDGFSGGAVFSAVKTSTGIQHIFDGIITRAGEGSIYVVDSGFVFGLALRS